MKIFSKQLILKWVTASQENDVERENAIWDDAGGPKRLDNVISYKKVALFFPC